MTPMATTKLRAGCYLRVSTTQQDVSMQRHASAALAKQRGWTVVRVFCDEGHSGASDKRPALRELLAAAKRGEFDVVIAYKLDRLGRSTPHLLATLAELETCGVKFVSVTEPIDTSSAMGTMITTVLGAIAQFERDMLIERTRDGLAAARRRGARLGRPRRYVDVERAMRMKRAGMAWPDIARELAVSERTLSRAVAALN